MKKYITIMFKFGRKGYTFPYQNKYKLIYFQPSIHDLENYILQLERDFDGHYSVLESYLEEYGFTRAGDLFSNPDHLFNLVFELFDGGFPRSLIGIRNLETGEINYKFHCGIYDYHPNEGYVILQKHCDRDYASADRHFKILSLRTGKELEGLFVEHISGIENLKFHAVKYNSRIDYPAVYEINESCQEIRELGYFSEDELDLLPTPNNSQVNEFDIEEQYNYDFYQDDESFDSYIVRKAQL